MKLAKVLGLAAVLLAASALAPAAAQADQSVLIIQGRLTDTSGRPLDGAFDTTFRIFTVPVGGAAIFSETYAGANAVTVNRGLFTVALGDLTMGGLPAAIFDGTDRFLEIEVAGDGPMAPRSRLGVAPLALNALTLEGKSASDFASANHRIQDHIDTVATGAQLNVLTQGGLATGLHTHLGTDIVINTLPGDRIVDLSIMNGKLATGAVDSRVVLDNSLLSADIMDNTITSADILDETIQSADILNETIQSVDILDGTITSADIMDATILGADIASETITGANILDNTVASADITDLTITNADVAPNAAILISKIQGNDVAILTSGTLLELFNQATPGVGVARDVLVIRSVQASSDNDRIAFRQFDNASMTPNLLASAFLSLDNVSTLTASDGLIDNADGEHTHSSAGLAPGSVTTVQILNETILSEDIMNGTITSADIMDATITGADIALETITGANILNGSVGSLDITDNSITSGDILDATITGADIALETITGANILDGSVGSLDITDNSITSGDILDATITGADIALETITGANILNGSVGSLDITDNSITSADILDATITGADIAAETITGNNIQDGTVASADITDNSITSADILDATITGADVALETLTGANILNGSVGSLDITDNSITSTDILDGTILNADIADNTITAAKILDEAGTDFMAVAGPLAVAGPPGAAAALVSLQAPAAGFAVASLTGTTLLQTGETLTYSIDLNAIGNNVNAPHTISAGNTEMKNFAVTTVTPVPAGTSTFLAVFSTSDPANTLIMSIDLVVVFVTTQY